MHDVPRLSPLMASRKLQALAFIEQYYAARGAGPSLSELAAALNCNRSRAQDAVRQLAREGRIRHAPGVPRGIRPISAEEEALRRLQAAGYIVTNAGLLPPAVLDHVPAQHGKTQKQESGGTAPHARH
ncbi:MULTISPECIES: LexA family protein [unclassified Sphingobium]|uniref:LexA family protein n=1 Tax=unclassified Sphingobium TaxID=2611147 RepID=UPI002225709C|nr:MULTISPECIES: hypothetical protein [unclassified Sphingobium]MCW2412022.1 DNA-binding transcriptional MocR family regulator [Sphingobium sp. B8D3D]MCW2415680.1 DNA-binding transcriptional MocR family regulator [Sphingobium sp. B8D3A]